MTLGDLIARYRTAANDKVIPPFATDEELIDLFNDGESEACLRGRLIHESSSTAMCRIAVSPGRSSYSLHPSMYELDHVGYFNNGAAERCKICLVSAEWLDASIRDWRDLKGTPTHAIQQDKGIRLVPEPIVAGELVLEGYRLPKSPMEGLDDEPEINSAHHRHLVHWALHRVFSVPDTEAFDPNRAALAEQEFTRMFGLRPDADLRRITREDVPHHVEAFWP